MRVLIVALSVLLLLTGCQSLIGSGPLTLSPLSQMIYERASQNTGTAYVAVAVDGSIAGYSVCTAGYASQCGGAPGEQVAIKACERNAKGKKCYIYAHGKTVVWDFDGPALPGSAGTGFAPDDKRELLSGKRWTTASVVWTQGVEASEAPVYWNAEGTLGNFDVSGQSDSRGDCEGEVRRWASSNKASWNMTCAGGETFDGFITFAEKASVIGLNVNDNVPVLTLR